MNASFGNNLHCVAAEPLATFLRVAVSSRSREVAFETVVLVRLKRGFRVLQLRSLLGTRIELCYLLVRITFGREPNLWITPRQARWIPLPQRTCRRIPDTARIGSFALCRTRLT